MYTSFTLNNRYRAQPASAQVHKDAENIQEFASLELLQASPEYIAAIQAQNDGFTQDEKNWQNERDRLQRAGVIKYDNHFFDMSQESYRKMVDVRESLKRRNKTISWRCKDLNGEHARYALSRTDIEVISDAFSDAMEQIDIEADTGFPVDPWPLEI